MKVLLTGGADGLGKCLANELLAQKARLTILDIKKPKTKNINFIKLDMANIKSVEKFTNKKISKKSKYDLIILNAGISAVGKFEKIAMQQQQKVLRVNLLAPMVLAMQLVKNGNINVGGKIIFISSLSHFTSYPGGAVYGAGKSALAIYGKSLKKAAGERGIKIINVFPGPIDTNHAKKYAPKNSSGKNRMSPEKLARQILVARRDLIAPTSAKLVAVLAKLFPRFIAMVMKKVIFDRF